MATMMIESQYLPPLEFFTALLKYPDCVIDIHENYQKQSYRNRCYILTSHGVMPLTVPVIKGNSKQKMKDVKIDYTQKWLNVHWRGITSAYGKAPFFEYYVDLLHQIFFKKPVFLFDLNQQLLTLCLKLLYIPAKITYTEKYIDENEKKRFLNHIDLKSVINPKKEYQQNQIYMPMSYTQHFGNDFVPNLSILDLLFCEGNNSASILKQSLHS